MTDQAKRRSVLALIAGGAASFTPPWIHAQSLDTMAIKLDWSPHAMHCPFHLCTERGWFKKAGLDVTTIEDGTGSTTTVQVVGGGGQFDVGHAALAPMAIGAAKGLNIISVAGFLRKGDMGILVDQKLGVKKLQELEGKSINFTAGSLEGPFVEPFFALNKMPGKVKLVNVSAQAKLSTYVQGSVDGIVTSVPTFFVMLRKIRPVEPLLFADYGLNLPGFGLVVRPDALKTKGEPIRRLASLLCATWEYIYAGNQDEAARALVAQRPKGGISREEVVDSLAVYRPFFYSDSTKGAPIGMQNEADWSATLSQMEVAKVVPAGTKPSQYFTNAYIDHALGNRFVRG